MWVCRLPVHIGPLGSYEFAAAFRKKQLHSAGRTEASAPTKQRYIDLDRTFLTRCRARRCISGGRTMFLKHWRFGQIRNSRLAFSAVAAAASSAEMPRSAAIFFATNGTRLGSLRRPLNGSGAI